MTGFYFLKTPKPETLLSVGRAFTNLNPPEALVKTSPWEAILGIGRLSLGKRVEGMSMTWGDSCDLLGFPRKLGSMVSKWVISPTYKWDILGLGGFVISLNFQTPCE